MSRTAPADVVTAIRQSVSAVCDPEYPEVTISELGILEGVSSVDGGSSVRIELVPTMLGCPALDVIARDVTDAARSACAGADVSIDVTFVDDPVWTPDRIASSAVDFLAREFSVAVRSRVADATCPICGSTALEHRSDFGPTPCRSVEWCPQCRNPIEVVGRVDLPLATAAMGAAPSGSAAMGAAPSGSAAMGAAPSGSAAMGAAPTSQVPA